MSSLNNMTSEERKNRPVTTGVLDYFPDAVAYVALISKIGNDKHNPGQPLHWAKEKSTDHADCIVRHLIDRGSLDSDGYRHSGYLAWRALALLQTEIEKEVKLNNPPRMTAQEIIQGGHYPGQAILTDGKGNQIPTEKYEKYDK